MHKQSTRYGLQGAVLYLKLQKESHCHRAGQRDVKFTSQREFKLPRLKCLFLFYHIDYYCYM